MSGIGWPHTQMEFLTNKGHVSGLSTMHWRWCKPTPYTVHDMKIFFQVGGMHVAVRRETFIFTALMQRMGNVMFSFCSHPG